MQEFDMCYVLQIQKRNQLSGERMIRKIFWFGLVWLKDSKTTKNDKLWLKTTQITKTSKNEEKKRQFTTNKCQKMTKNVK